MENNTVMKKEKFEKEFYDILKRALFCTEKARYESLLSLEDFINQENGDWIGEEMRWEMQS